MSEWLSTLGYSLADIDRLNVIHVAGTKGKGSTCAFTESLLRAYGQRTGFPSKTGLYTSPHLTRPEERIRINFEPLDQHRFAKYFFEVWDVLSKLSKRPRYLQLFALFATHVFMREGVEAAIYETHHGGEYDATNFFHKPIATIITPLGIDHAKQLGPTLNNIAWHKAGIFKTGAVAFAAAQDPGPADVLRNRAAEKKVDLRFVSDEPDLPKNSLQLKPDVQRGNCAVALACLRSFITATHRTESLQLGDIQQGVASFEWPGRFQYIGEGNQHWFLDGAHNEMSVVKAAEWFIEASGQVENPATRILIFGQVSEQREAPDVLSELARALDTLEFDHIIFTNFSCGKPLGGFKVTRVTRAEIHLGHSLESALDYAVKLGAETGRVHTFVTGSLHLMGATLRYLTAREGITSMN
ncbi:folylpolyglutamate synthase [Astrocystis sublimbata]|nr:folylpolyglutamate synthase [Astrocystis sublimbata]